jgi:hypothetical protein
MTLRNLQFKELETGEWEISQKSEQHFQTEYDQWAVTARYDSDWSVPYEGELRYNGDEVKLKIGFHSLKELQGSLITMIQFVDEANSTP